MLGLGLLAKRSAAASGAMGVAARPWGVGATMWRALSTTSSGSSAPGIVSQPQRAGKALPMTKQADREPLAKRNKYANMNNRAPRMEIVSRVVAVDSTRKTTKGGRINSFRAMVVAGNGNGAGGFAVGKGRTVRAAIDKAYRHALTNWVPVDLSEDKGVFYDVIGKKNNTRVLLRACKPYNGLTASPLIKCLCDTVGIENATTKILGRTTTSSVVYAFFDALGKLHSPEDLSLARGMKVKRITRFRHRG
ncbi:30S ribosomal protein S5, chloroplastic [Hondaea fermentalgiana]|uniref:30S ribosomal protein S5, chloroplastic n=1 Tax=Hondaea fermentalgiana TaxID=2315210 RepID=A0A2R5GL59_9STRA|nr:30S ribosomal protein S5, chloroplastic [Hondaea fermentalgiana]|eukprot:GBG31642.1 30S ribosomal protein S5, chloroplastic [Hondaea fermentalgiana]